MRFVIPCGLIFDPHRQRGLKPVAQVRQMATSQESGDRKFFVSL